MSPKRRASLLNDRARELEAAGRRNEAISAYREAGQADSKWSVPWFNLGLLFKRSGEWQPSFEANREALSRDPGDGDAWWNLGIAATALGRWSEAREAWVRCGITIPEGTGPIEGNFGLTPMRLDPQNRGEVVWCDRIDPARGIIRNIPLPESGYSYGDVILHDGAPNGYRLRDGIEVPVFDELERLARSSFTTFVLDIPDSTVEVREALSDVACRMGGAAEDWSQSIMSLCRMCSEGRPHEHHDAELAGSRPNLAVAAAAADERHLEAIIERWRGETGYSGYVGRMRAASANE